MNGSGREIASPNPKHARENHDCYLLDQAIKALLYKAASKPVKPTTVNNEEKQSD